MFDLFDFFNDDFFDIPTIYRSEIKCKKCGRSYDDFRRTGKLGCMECYSVFSKPLGDVLIQIHQNPKHVGKIPKNIEGGIFLKRKIEDLKQKLQEAVKKEDYELAAKLHKEINELEGRKAQ